MVRMRKLILPTAAVLTLATEAAAQVTAPPSLSGSLIQMLIGLLGILALLGASLWLLKKLTVQRGAAAGLLRVVAATQLGGRERVVIVEVGSTWLVLGVAPGRVSALAEIPRQPLPEKSRDASPAGLPGWLQTLMRRPRV